MVVAANSAGEACMNLPRAPSRVSSLPDFRPSQIFQNPVFGLHIHQPGRKYKPDTNARPNKSSSFFAFIFQVFFISFSPRSHETVEPAYCLKRHSLVLDNNTRNKGKQGSGKRPSNFYDGMTFFLQLRGGFQRFSTPSQHVRAPAY